MNYVSRLTLLICILAGAGTLSPAPAQKRRTARTLQPPPASAESRQGPVSPEARRRLETFLKAWSTLGENYFDPTFNNLNWNKIRSEYEPRVRASRSDGELYALLNEMIARLQRSHLAIITPEVYQAIERAKVEAKTREVQQEKRTAEKPGAESPVKTADPDDPLSQYGIGVDLRLIDDRFVVSRVNAGSPAEIAGVRTGYVIEKINGVSLSDLLKRINLQKIDTAKIKRYLPFEIVGSFLNGEKDSYVTVTYLDENNSSKDVRIKRERLKTQTVSLGRNFPERQLEFEARALSDDIGYIRFNIFAIPVIGRFCDAVGEFRNKKALIIDLRGNMGGIVATMVALAGMLTDSSVELGTSIYKSGSEDLIAASKAKNFKGKVVFLVDNQTVSAAEIFAASMQDSGRAVVIGEKTAGEALPSVALGLPTGAVLLYPIANYRSPSGRYLEGSGVTPDKIQHLSRERLISGVDDQLQAAVDAIRTDSIVAVRRKAPPEPAKAAAQSPSLSMAVAPPVAREAIPLIPDEAAAAIKPPLPRPAPQRAKADVKDAEALKVIGEFVTSIGGHEALRSMTSYSLKGSAELLVKGTRNQFDLEIYYQKPGKYAEIMRSDAAGEIREVHSGKANFVQADYGMTRDLPEFANTGDLDILAPIRNLSDPGFYRSLTYAGVFDRSGRRVKLIDGRTSDGYYLALAFDVETKELVSFTGSYYAMNFSDYRKVGDLRLPFRIERERVMNVVIDDIVVNAPIDGSKFEKKENCFDKAN